MATELKISEHDHQVTVIQWANTMTRRWPCLEFLYAVPNGSRTAMSTAKKAKAEGMKKGVPDLCLPYPKYKMTIPGQFIGSDSWHGLYIEMKTKGGVVRKEQKRWLAYLESVGYKTAVAWSADEAINIIKEYLYLETSQ